MKKAAVKKHPWKNYFQRKRRQLLKEDQLRHLQVIDQLQPGYVIEEGQSLLNLSSNDYLGLAASNRAREDAQVLSEIMPFGAGASRLLNANLALHNELERSLADWKKTETALVYPSGFQANLGLVSALGQRGVVIYGDRLNHASLVDGARLANATFHRYAHNDLDELEDLLKAQTRGLRLIVTDGVFSMDGDLAPLPQLNEIAKRHDALLIVDEAHATGVLGPEGAGSWSHYGLEWEPHVIFTVTLSKALGLQGGAVCASQELVDYLVNYSRSFIYSTALSPLMAGLAHTLVTYVREADDLRQRLMQNTQTFQDALAQHGLNGTLSPTPIIPLELGESGKVMNCIARLREAGIVAAGVRPPTVPEGTARLRLSISAAHPPQALQKAAQTIAETIQHLDEQPENQVKTG